MVQHHKLISLSEVLSRTGYCKAWVYRQLKENRFPRSVKIGVRSMAFIESEVDEWINQRLSESRGGITL